MIANNVKYLKAQELWNNENYLLAGKELFESISDEEKIVWLTSLLKEILKIFNNEELSKLIDISKSRESWGDARFSFEKIREIKLKTDDILYIVIFDLIENIAKTIYNMSNQLPKYDLNSSWKISKNIKDIITNNKSNEEFGDELLRIYWCLNDNEISDDTEKFIF